jgi:hypothetical protein
MNPTLKVLAVQLAFAFGVEQTIHADWLRVDALPVEPSRFAHFACCSRAVVMLGCVCSYVTRCDVHGERHNGTHD